MTIKFLSGLNPTVPLAIAGGGHGQITALAGFDALKQQSTTSYVGATALSTDAQFKTGTVTSVAVTPSNVRNSLGFSNFYDSGATTAANNTTVTFAHGLGVRPMFYQFYLVCTTADTTIGYAVGDQILTSPYSTDDNGVGSYGFGAFVDATNIKCPITLLKVTSSSTGSPNPLSPQIILWTKWKIRVVCWG